MNGTNVAGAAARDEPPRALYRNEGNGTFTDVTAAAGLQRRAVRHGRRRRPTSTTTASRTSSSRRSARIICSTTPGTARSSTSRTRPGLGGRPGFSTSALWFDYDRDGWLDLLICNYVKWTPETRRLLQRRRQAEVVLHARRRIAARRRGCSATSGDGTFEDVTAKAGLFDATSKSLGVTLLDYDLDVWPDVFIANDTQPNKLYRNNGNGTFTELGLQAGLAFSEEGRARAGMGGGRCRRGQHGPHVGRRHQLLRRDARALQARRRRAVRRRVAAHRHRPRDAATRSGSAASSSTWISTDCRICSSSTATSTTRSARLPARVTLRRAAAPVPQ